MRIDKFLKVSRIIKRRTIAKEACDTGRISINDRVAKASTEVKEGDIIEIRFGTKHVRAKILDVREHVVKDGAKELFEILEGEAL
jgi:ribosomal 50S subunit-recycling heat shock protein